MNFFPIARAIERNHKTEAGMLKGKYGYMSPEQARGEPVDTKSDLFSAASVMYELFTQDKLFPGDEAGHRCELSGELCESRPGAGECPLEDEQCT